MKVCSSRNDLGSAPISFLPTIINHWFYSRKATWIRRLYHGNRQPKGL